MDDQNDVNQIVGEETNVSTPSVEEPTTTEEVTTPEPTGEEVQTETDESSKKGANARIRELNAKANRAEERAKSLEQQIAELTGSVDSHGVQTPYTPQVDLTPGAEFNPEQYKQDVLKTAESLVDIRVKQSNAVNRINTETNQVVRQYPQLDPDSDSFDPDLSKWITETTMDLVKASPYTASPKKIVENLMKPYQRSVSKEVGKVSESIAKQASQTALRPTSVSTKGEKPDSELSITELEKKYGVVS